jgi:hypothetical protein
MYSFRPQPFAIIRQAVFALLTTSVNMVFNVMFTEPSKMQYRSYQHITVDLGVRWGGNAT